MPFTAPIPINVSAYPTGTIPFIELPVALFDTQGGPNGRTVLDPSTEKNYYLAGLPNGAPNKYFAPSTPTILSKFQPGKFIDIKINISQHSNPRVVSRHCRVEYQKVLVQYFSKSENRWKIVYNDIPAPTAPVEDNFILQGNDVPVDSFTLTNGTISVRAGTNARNAAGSLRGDVGNNGGQSGYRVSTNTTLQSLDWSDAECIFASVLMRAVGPGASDVVPKYIAATEIRCFASNFSFIPAAFDENVPKYKPVGSNWEHFCWGVGPLPARLATNPCFGMLTNPLPIDVLAGNSLAQLRSNLISTVASNPAGNLNLRVIPANALITDPGSMTLSNADGFNLSRTITVDFNGLNLSGGETADIPSQRLPIFVETIPAKGAAAPPAGTPFKISIRDTRWQAAPVGERALLGISATSLYCSIRLGWQELRTTLINPVRSGGVTVWDMNSTVSNYLRLFWPVATQEEYTFEAGQIYNSFALKPLYSEPGTNDLPAIILLGTKTQPVSINIQDLVIRDRVLLDKEYSLDQQNDSSNWAGAPVPNTTLLSSRWLPAKGIKILEANNVLIANSSIYNVDGEAMTINAWSRNVTVDRNVFHKIGGQAIAKGIDFVGVGDPVGVIVNTDYGFAINITRNAFYQIGQNQFTGAAVYAFSGFIDSTISNNLIEEVAYSAISIGFPRGTRNANGIGVLQYDQNQIKNVDLNGNLIQRVMVSSVDGGGIYTKGSVIGGLIRNNHIRLVGPTSLNSQGTTNNFYGAQIGVGSNLANYGAPVAHLYYDDGSFGWTASNNRYGLEKFANIEIQKKLYVQGTTPALSGNPLSVRPGTLETNADPILNLGEVTTPSQWGAINAVPVVVPLLNSIVNRKAWFSSYGVQP
jgi:hypothetical protein